MMKKGEKITERIKRGRPSKDPDEVLRHMRCFRTNDFEDEWIRRLAEMNHVSENAYLRNLVMEDYRKYAQMKMDEAMDLGLDFD